MPDTEFNFSGSFSRLSLESRPAEVKEFEFSVFPDVPFGFLSFHFLKIELMISGLYSGAAVLNSIANQQEATAANLAHLNTAGHRRAIFSFAEPPRNEELEFDLPTERREQTVADFSPGRKDFTGRTLDLAIQGDGFFQYQTPDGLAFSRNGVLHRDIINNHLVNSEGYPLIGSNDLPVVYDGPLNELQISDEGVIFNAGREVGRLAIVQFDDNQKLESENQTWFRQGQAQIVPTADATIMQGARELSNASPVTELISLIVGSRHFEATQRAMRTIADSMQESIRA